MRNTDINGNEKQRLYDSLVKEVKERISKKTKDVIRSADSMTPSVAPSVSRRNIQ